MTGRLSGKTAVITGAASGIGEGTARRFIEEGAQVVIADLQEDKGLALAKELGESACFSFCDVTVEDQVAAAVDKAVSEFGKLDCMVNNAGIVGAVGPIKDTSLEVWDRTINILLRGVFLGSKHAARVMMPQESGVILSIASTAGVIGGLGPHVYTAAKHGVVGLTKSVSSELCKYGIRVNCVAPGNTATAMTADMVAQDHQNIDAVTKAIAESSMLGISGEPSDIANALLYLASDEARYVTGHTLVVDAGQTTGGMVAGVHEAEPNLIREAGNRGT
jgi:NAD(P)-dependent dehydrogenase (short-subunit alcohol dehydrogenase family)